MPATPSHDMFWGRKDERSNQVPRLLLSSFDQWSIIIRIIEPGDPCDDLSATARRRGRVNDISPPGRRADDRNADQVFLQFGLKSAARFYYTRSQTTIRT